MILNKGVKGDILLVPGGQWGNIKAQGDQVLNIPLTLFTPAYFGISGTGGGHIVPPLSILGLGGVRVPILFGNDLPMND